ncbi:MAG: hypothetical protein JSS69_17095 [Acidobacteria bacterium]|nr:hypothetical protein [Acidobacteriota bacterium]MBS1867633.1 hypothetical protein [Acidobacteriota bacterium]
MGISAKNGALCLAFVTIATIAAVPASADEIRLKDGKKLYGVIVAYEDNMFKVKTDYGYVLVEKDKIAAIVPNTPAGQPADAKPAAQPAKNESPATNSTSATEVSAKNKIANANVKPTVPSSSTTASVAAPNFKTAAPAANGSIAANAIPPTPPKDEPPPNKEEIQGNQYTNFTHGFRMYKAPSWELIEDARKALPNAIVALGTSNESTLMVVGEEKTKEPLEAAAAGVEKRLREIYSNYRLISQRKTTVGGMPAVEYKYRGMADDHDWSGTLVVIARGKDVLTALGMTFADSDLIQIQENVIARSISSLDFSARN